MAQKQNGNVSFVVLTTSYSKFIGICMDADINTVDGIFVRTEADIEQLQVRIASSSNEKFLLVRDGSNERKLRKPNKLMDKIVSSNKNFHLSSVV